MKLFSPINVNRFITNRERRKMTEIKKTNWKHSMRFMSTGMMIGIALGVAIGIAMDNLGVGIAIGIALGSGIGAGIGGARKTK